jgi:hypothetical protein
MPSFFWGAMSTLDTQRGFIEASLPAGMGQPSATLPKAILTRRLRCRYNPFRPETVLGNPVAMTTTEQELDSFTRFAKQRLSTSGETELSLDELFDLWRAENPSDERYAENVAAVREAINDFKNGDRGTPAREHSDQIRREFGIETE